MLPASSAAPRHLASFSPDASKLYLQERTSGSTLCFELSHTQRSSQLRAAHFTDAPARAPIELDASQEFSRCLRRHETHRPAEVLPLAGAAVMPGRQAVGCAATVFALSGVGEVCFAPASLRPESNAGDRVGPGDVSESRSNSDYRPTRTLIIILTPILRLIVGVQVAAELVERSEWFRERSASCPRLPYTVHCEAAVGGCRCG